MTEFNLNQTRTQLSNLNPFNLLNNYEKFMSLKIYVDDDKFPGLKQKYIEHVLNHNNKMLNPNNFNLDAGFDLFNPVRKELSFNTNRMNVNKFDFGIICSAQTVTNSKLFNTGYYMYPRSSLSKTKLRLANSTGIIDSGYRGNLIGMFDLMIDCFKFVRQV